MSNTNRHTAPISSDEMGKAFEFSWFANCFSKMEECVPGKVLCIHCSRGGIAPRFALLALLALLTRCGSTLRFVVIVNQVCGLSTNNRNQCCSVNTQMRTRNEAMCQW